MAYKPQCERCGESPDCPEGSDLQGGLCVRCERELTKECAADQEIEAAWLVGAEYCAEAQEDLLAT